MFSFFALMFLDVSIVSLGIRSHIVKHLDLTSVMMLREGTLYLILFFLNCTILPSIVLEANEVEVSDEQVTFRNLVFSQTVKWSDITSVVAPIYLKFAIIRWPGHFQLINKRDITDFDRLLQTIKTKTGLPAK